MQLDRGMSIKRYLPATGTAGLDRILRQRIKSRSLSAAEYQGNHFGHVETSYFLFETPREPSAFYPPQCTEKCRQKGITRRHIFPPSFLSDESGFYSG